MTKQMKLNLANCYQKILTEKKIQTLLIMDSQKVVIVVSIFLPLTRGTASVKFRYKRKNLPIKIFPFYLGF